MAKDSDRLGGGFEAGESGGGLSGLLAEEDDFDRRTLWRLGSWAAVSVSAIIVALITNQSSIGLRREQTASVDILRQAQQIQIAARDSQNETRRLALSVDTLNSDRDRLYSRVTVLEQGLDSVTGAIARQAPGTPTPASTGSASTSQVSASAAPPATPSLPAPVSPPSPAPALTASIAPTAAIASVDVPPAAAKPSLAAPVVAPVAATAAAVAEKQDKQVSAAIASQPSPAMKSALVPPSAPAQPSGSLMASKSMMDPPDPAAGKLIEPVAPTKAVMAVPIPEVVAVVPKASEEVESDASPELVAKHTEFGVDVGGANTIPGLRAVWRGLLKSRSNAALTKLRPIIVIRENGSGMQLRLVAGPISDAAAAAKICASLTVSDRSCTTAVFEGQRLSVGAEDPEKADTRTTSESKPGSDSKADSGPKGYSHKRYGAKHSSRDEDAPKSEPSTLSLIFGRR